MGWVASALAAVPLIQCERSVTGIESSSRELPGSVKPFRRNII